MNTNLLVDRLPETVNVSGSLIPIETNFRTYILLELLFNDRDASDEEKVYTALSLTYGRIIEPMEDAVNAMLWFYRAGKPEPRRGRPSDRARVRRIYDYEQDDAYIYAAFLDQYGIDLNEIEYIHWWKFKALFHSLKDDNEIVKIMGYRSIDIGKIKDKDQRMKYAQLKARYRLDENLTEEEKAERVSGVLGGMK